MILKDKYIDQNAASIIDKKINYKKGHAAIITDQSYKETLITDKIKNIKKEVFDCDSKTGNARSVRKKRTTKPKQSMTLACPILESFDINAVVSSLNPVRTSEEPPVSSQQDCSQSVQNTSVISSSLPFNHNGVNEALLFSSSSSVLVEQANQKLTNDKLMTESLGNIKKPLPTTTKKRKAKSDGNKFSTNKKQSVELSGTGLISDVNIVNTVIPSINTVPLSQEPPIYLHNSIFSNALTEKPRYTSQQHQVANASTVSFQNLNPVTTCGVKKPPVFFFT